MNKLRTNPNTLLQGSTALALAATALLGPAACAQPDSRPTPTPYPSKTPTLAPDVPPKLTCATKIVGSIIDGTVTLGVNVRNDNRDAAYTVDETRYDFGDGQARAVEGIKTITYTYSEEGHFVAKASIEGSYGHGIDMPARKGGITDCSPIGFYVEKPR